MKKLLKKQNGGAASQIKSGVKQVAKGVKKGVDDSIDSAKSTAKAVVKASPGYQAYKAAGSAMKSVDDSLQKRYPNYTKKGSFYDGAKQAVKSVMGYKKGGATKYQDGGPMRPSMKPIKKTSENGYFPVQNAPKVTISPSSAAAKKAPAKKANPPKSTMDLIRGSKKSDYMGTVTQAAKKGGSVKKMQDGGKVTNVDIRNAKKEAKPKAKYGMSMRRK